MLKIHNLALDVNAFIDGIICQSLSGKHKLPSISGNFTDFSHDEYGLKRSWSMTALASSDITLNGY